ncbi:MAG: DNRLRE domain-containing protein [Planctomycetaceae bacterium]
MAVGASQDTSIFNVGQGDVSNGAGEYVLSGGEGSDETAIRGLIHFDLNTSSIPFGATILDVTLRLNAAYSVGGAANISLHRVSNAWGEGASDALDDELDGAAAAAQDATWIYRFYNGSQWNSPGGDFSAGESASASVGAAGLYQWNDLGMISDVQSWLDDASQNFGWMLLSESVPGSVKAFHSHDSSNAALRPSLEITYEEPILPALVAGRAWDDSDGNGLRVPLVVHDLQLQFYQQKDFFNVYRGQEYWYRSAVNNEWYFLTPDGTLTHWDRTPGQLSGTAVSTISRRFWELQNKHLLLKDAVQPEAYLNGVTVELLDSQGVVQRSTVTGDFDVNNDGLINPETESGWYRFEQVPAGDYQVRQILPTTRTASSGDHSGLATTVHQLDSQLNLRFYKSLFEDFGGEGERWFLGDNGWYYILPTGEVYRWKAQPITPSQPLTGTLVVELNHSYFRDPSLIYLASNPVVAAVDGTTIDTIDLPSFEAIEISGRIWHDQNGDGLPGRQDYPTVHALATAPAGGPAKAVFWYQSAGVGNGPVYYYADQFGNIFEWAASSGSKFVTQVWGGFELTSQSILETAFIVEPYLNGWAVELVDAAGRVVGTATSTDLDKNADQVIQASSERGWYVFNNVLPGEYTVRQAVHVDWVRTTTHDPMQQLTDLQFTYGFKRVPKDWYDFGFRQERWFQSRDNYWFYITPDGSIFEWDRRSGGAKGLVNGTLVAQTSSSCYLNMELLFAPAAKVLKAPAGAILNTVSFGNLRLIDSLFGEIESQLHS